MKEKIKRLLKPRIKLVPGTRLTSFLFIALSVAIAAGILIAANLYYNIDTGQIVSEEIMSITGQNKQLRFTVGSNYIAIQAPSNLSTTSVYTLPTSTAPQADYLLAGDPSGNLYWFSPSAVGGSIRQVGDVPYNSTYAFTSQAGTQYGNILWFHPNETYTMALTAADTNLTANATTIIPAVSGTNYLTLGTGTSSWVAYWSDTHTLTAEQYLSTTRGGIGANSSGWTGMVRVNGGSWGTITNSPNYVAVWDSTGNFITGVNILDLARGGTGANLSGAGAQGGVVYKASGTALGITGAGTTNQILISQGSSAPIWANLASLITAQNGLTLTGTTNVTLELGGTLLKDTTLSLGDYNMIFNMTGSGDFKVQDAGTDILVVSDDGKIYYKTYPLAQPGKLVFREAIPILGFDLPVQTATTSWVQVSRDIENYPFSSAEAGATRVHKLIVRYSASTTAPIDVRVNAETNNTYSTATLPVPESNDLNKGEVRIIDITIPTDGTDWHLDVKTTNVPDTVRIYEILLAAYDQIL